MAITASVFRKDNGALVMQRTFNDPKATQDSVTELMKDYLVREAYVPDGTCPDFEIRVQPQVGV